MDSRSSRTSSVSCVVSSPFVLRRPLRGLGFRSLLSAARGKAFLPLGLVLPALPVKVW